MYPVMFYGSWHLKLRIPSPWFVNWNNLNCEISLKCIATSEHSLKFEFKTKQQQQKYILKFKHTFCDFMSSFTCIVQLVANYKQSQLTFAEDALHVQTTSMYSTNSSWTYLPNSSRPKYTYLHLHVTKVWTDWTNCPKTMSSMHHLLKTK